ncbi:hypothetical protein SHIRM173S_06125 [Streptomyces hirsutus]
MSRTGASTPEVTKTVAAASSSVFSLRRASVRLGRPAHVSSPTLPSLSLTGSLPLLPDLLYGTWFRTLVPERGSV